MSRLVTGDAVVLGLQPARVPSRALAVALDLAVVVGAYLLVSVVVISTVLPLGTATAAAVQVALFVLLLVGVPVAVETLSHGRSLGKVVCGLRVVRDDGGPVRFRHALVRQAVGFLEIVATFGSVALIASLVSAEGRRLGDVFAGTLVVRERIPGGRPQALPEPPAWLAGRLTELDLSRVPESLWLAVRQYLARTRQLDPQVAWSMAVTLCNDLAGRTGKPAPPDVHPGAYLAAVVAERRRRDARRAFGPGADGAVVNPGGQAAAGAAQWAAPAPTGGKTSWPATAAGAPPTPGVSHEPRAARPDGSPRSQEAGTPTESGRRPTGFVPPF